MNIPSPTWKYNITVDGTDVMCEEKKKNGGKQVDPSIYSHKFKHSGYRYEVGVAIFSSKIVHVQGPFDPGVFNDQEIFTDFGLESALREEDERAVVDCGYYGRFVSRRDEGNDKWKAAKARYLARHETVNRRIKVFDCLVNRWRHGIELHLKVFRVVIVLVNIELKYAPIFDAYSRPPTSLS